MTEYSNQQEPANQYSQDVIMEGDELYKTIWDAFPAQSAIQFDLRPFVMDCTIILCDKILNNVDNIWLSDEERAYWQSVKSYLQSLK